MGDIVNLRQVRKARARIDKARAADANRVKFGRTRAEKAAALAERERMARDIDGARRVGADGIGIGGEPD